ncbi:YceI family protein [Sphingobacterium sp. Mn56C]|uniref:YceI family protein n=1 Tax=Sphingobacterium sp. Mn56C TaxID=3395261 RepID=UPI003BBA4A1C
MTVWNLDITHSELEFKARHLMISSVKGSFKDFSVILKSETDDITQSQIDVSIQVNSIDTKNESRDEHLKGKDFFDTSIFPVIVFTSTSVELQDNDNYLIAGVLTIKGISQPITLKAEYGGVAKDHLGNAKAGFTVKGSINRSEFGLTWNTALETGGVMVSEEIKFSADLQFIKS